MTKRVELLAPCGSYESFLAAVNAGADAVYLGGRQFGARAYAENFLEDELVSVIGKAHLSGVKVYLTVNTLVKEKEFSGLYDYLLPLYEAGLDGVIVQDMGVFCFLKRNFPDLKLHASTQMTITGAYGAAYLKEMGCERIVPARELSLQEIKEIKSKVSIEIEAFIHGAMCYCYSGQCLMSSMIGGRSGNRGRCAGPCRLPYQVAGKEAYYLSLKDMNTLEHIPQLIEAGIDSFKIEGRMKKPEYVAGVVSVYRKYIDRYYETACAFPVEQTDMRMLSNLYIRSETGNGYYEKKNGRDMLTLHKPGYNEADKVLLKELQEKYICELPQKEIRLYARCRADEQLYGEVRFADPISEKEICLSVSGALAVKADNRAVSKEEISGQLVKTGGTPFAVKECIVELGDNTFVPMSRIKALRRELLQKIYEYYGARNLEGKGETAETGNKKHHDIAESDKRKERKEYTLTVLVQTREQFEAVLSAGINGAGQRAVGKGKEYLIVDADLLMEDTEIQKKLSESKVHWGIKCPVILRKSDEKFLQKLQEIIEERKPEIVYCAAIDTLAWVKSISYTGKIAGEASLYAWNKEAVFHWGETLDRISIPLELESKEIRELCIATDKIDRTGQCKGEVREAEKTKGLSDKLEAPVYGRAPFMVAANCIKLSAGKCDKNRQRYTELKDRLGNIFPVYTNCSHCYNIIYNCLPTSYQDGLWMLMQDGIRAFRVEFTTESGAETRAVLQTFQALFASELTEVRKAAFRENGRIAGMEITQGRFRRSVE
ncbi:MAG: U32 family peptidase [Lachnospiraceae bacterium]|nr:U32 family peptidase [Lachnospiraceae bacterium]